MSKNQDRRPNRAEFQRTQSLRLPTPPPDPQTTSKPTTTTTDKCVDQQQEQCRITEKENNEFFEYLNSLPTSNKPQQNDKPPFQRSGSMFAPIMATEDAFDHLDKLYKLMEQLLNLREQNAKLQRRVRDLEHLRNLQNLDTLVTNRVLRGEESEIPDLDDDSIVAEALLDNMFNKTNKKYKSPTQFRFRQSILRPQRVRSTSVAFDGSMDPISPVASTSIPRNMSGKSLPERGILRKSSKVSKWTKVKAAFKWEKASPTVTGAKSQDSGIGGMLPINNEVARYLRVPSTCDNPTEAGASPADSVLSGSWNAVHGLSTPGTISPASSTDDLHPSAISEHRSVSRTDSGGNATNANRQFRASKTSDEEDGERRSRSLDYTGNCSCDSTQGNSKDDLLKLQISKSHKTPWGKVKDIIQTRKDSLKKKQHRLSARSDDYRNTDYSAGSDQEDVFEASAHSSNHDTPTVMVTNSEEDATLKMKSEQNIPADVVARYQKVVNEEEKCQPKSSNGSPRVQRRISKWTKVKKAFLTSASISRYEDDSKSMPSSPTNKNCHFFSEMPTQNWKSFDEDKCMQNKSIPENDLETRKLKEEIHKNYEQLQKKLSQEFQDKLHEWEKVKFSLNSAATSLAGSQTVGGCPATTEDRDPEFLKKMEEWERIKNQNTLEINKRRNIQMTSEENLPADFKKKLQEWQKIKKFGGREEEPSTSKSIKKKNEWQLWRSNSSTKQDNTMSLAQTESRQYSEDFLKKLDEWKQMKSSNSTYEDQSEHRKSLKENKTPSPNLARKSSGTKLIRQNKNHKMQEWLEKELQKIEREKQRLEREREKFLEREERLAKLRRSIGNSPHKKDVLVQTSTGFYRFEGISRKFTQRLYEWEKARGIGPEASTFALLNSGYHQISSNPVAENQAPSYRREQMPRIKLTRSKSMDSVANLACGGPLITHQPSSLSLNDVEELEMQCLEESQSERNLNEFEENLDYGEPEAVIVEVEDFVEETAAPLEAIASNGHHTPMYQTQTIKLCESGTCEPPQVVQRSDSTRASSNYKLIQESLNILNKMKDTEEACKLAEEKVFEKEHNEEIGKHTGAIPKKQKTLISKGIFNECVQDSLGIYYKQQTEISQGLVNKISILQDSNILKYTSNENAGYTISQPTDTLILTEELSAELISLTEKLKQLFNERRSEFNSPQKEMNLTLYNKYGLDINETINGLIFKIQELRRSLSYVCAATDVTAPGRNRKGSKKDRKYNKSSLEQISSTNEKAANNENTSDEEDQKSEKVKPPRRKEKLVKSKSEDNQMINYAKLQVTCFADQKKERTERCYQLSCSSKSQVHLNTKSFDNSENTENSSKLDAEISAEAFKKNKCQRKLIRSRRVSESCTDTIRNADETADIKTNQTQRQLVSPQNLNSNVIIPTHIQYLDATSVHSNANENTCASSSPVSVFVQTTRKMFTPFASEVFDKNDENFPKNETILHKKENEIKRNDSTKSKLLRRSHSPSESPMLPRKKRMTINENDDIDEKAPVEGTAEHLPVDNQNSQSRPSTPSHLPPLPNSPIIQRRERHLSKETSPAIRMMIARYNQKLSEQESSGGNKSAGSSGSASPVAWRSPVFERRVKAQTEKYQEEVNKSFVNKSSYSPLFMRKQVQKSASVGVIGPVKKQVTPPEIGQRGSSLDSSEKNASPKLIRGILKSTSVGSMKTNTVSECQENPITVTEEITSNKDDETTATLKITIPSHQSTNAMIQTSNLQGRAHKLQKAKEEFLFQKNDAPSSAAGPSSATFDFENQEKYCIKYPSRNRLSQVSCGSESSFDDINSAGVLIKSASAGMINVDEATYEQFRPEMHSQGYVSLPRATKKKDGKFGISSLASKFRKVKMRRIKDPTQMNTVSTLCRQSLVVDITGNSKENIEDSIEGKKNKKKSSKDSSSSDLHSPSTSKTSWIKNPTKIFKTKDSK